MKYVVVHKLSLVVYGPFDSVEDAVKWMTIENYTRENWLVRALWSPDDDMEEDRARAQEFRTSAWIRQ